MDSKQPLVSVVLNCFNSERYISEQIDSILSQSYANLELIVCDDHSTDRSLEIVQAYARKDPRVKWVQNDRNLGAGDRDYGVCLTFQRGFHLCQGEFIATSDADDYWLPGKIEMQVHYLLDHPEIDLVFTDSIMTNEDLSLKLGSFQRKLGNPFHGELISIELLLKRNLLPGHVEFFRRTLVPKISPIPKGLTHDSWTGLVVSLNGPLGYINQGTVLYRQHEGNLVGAEVTNMFFYLKRCNDAGFLQQHYKAKLELLPFYKKLLTFEGSVTAKNALHEKIACQTAVLEIMRATSFPDFLRRQIRAAWTILKTGQKYHLKQCLFLAFSWGGIRKLKPHIKLD